MVKADMNRDYYGDLDLPPTADINDIKKQFKKLALIYHPDRNPGRESEVTTKFQRIQSAHEVLTDAHEKARYDAVRSRSKSFASTAYTSHARGNPYANAGSQWPPPPKAPTARKPTGPPPSHGAQRYRNFETPKSSSYDPPPEGPGARAHMYTAWENMKQSQKPSPSQSWQNFQSQGPTAAQAFGTRRAERARQNQSRDYASKYAPDEGSYRKYSVPRDRDSFDYDGESSSPRGTTPRRSRSTGVPRRNGFMPSDPEGDEPPATNTSAYRRTNPPPTSTPDDFSNLKSSRSSQPMADPLKQFREQTDNPCEPRLSTPYATHGGEKTNPFDFPDLGRSKSTREPPTAFASTQKTFSSTDMPRTSSDPNLGSKNRNGASRPTAAGKARQQARPATDADSEDSDYIPRGKAGHKPSPGENREKFLSSEARKAAAATAGAKANTTMPSAPMEGTTKAGPTNTKEDDGTRIFEFNVDDDLFTTTKAQDKPPASTGAENVGSTFSPKDWDGKFDDAGFFTPEQRTEYGKGRVGPKSRGRSPPKPRPGAPREAPTASTEPGTSQEPIPQDWAQYFKPQTFIPPQQTKPRIPRSGVRRPRAPRSTSAVVDDDDDEDSSDGPPLFMASNMSGRTTFSGNGVKIGAPVDADSPDAMDIDTPPVVPSAPDVPVIPAMGKTPSDRPPSPVAVPPNLPSRAEGSKDKQSAQPTTNGEDMKINLDSLKQTEPIKQPTASGLNSFDDLISSLPFESRASLILPTAESFIPKAPPSPLTLTQATYADYVAEFKFYMNQWSNLNTRFVLHFAARKKQTMQFVDDFEHASDGLLNSYLEGLHEDQKIRTTWNEATKDYEIALKHFQGVQLKAKGLGLGKTAN
ncbi:hypothetical protein F5884DRAFT_420961 [Xylogone sp. PMI_703]|nr:hypothetical protein F5884DRAFT_420961 [Xylogone sp. PMI_703]